MCVLLVPETLLPRENPNWLKARLLRKMRNELDFEKRANSIYIQSTTSSGGSKKLQKEERR